MRFSAPRRGCASADLSLPQIREPGTLPRKLTPSGGRMPEPGQGEARMAVASRGSVPGSLIWGVLIEVRRAPSPRCRLRVFLRLGGRDPRHFALGRAAPLEVGAEFHLDGRGLDVADDPSRLRDGDF